MEISATIAQASSHNFWLSAAVAFLITIVCFYFCFRNLRRARIIEDTPTSRIRSAAQGYTELEGKAKLMDGEPIVAPLSGMQCTWYRYKIEERRATAVHGRRDTRWSTIENGVSDSIFYLEDETGKCIVDPEGAAVTPSIKISWRGHSRRPLHTMVTSGIRSFFSSGRYRYTEERIHPGDPLYALGLFQSLGGVEESTIENDTRELLSQWKADKNTLLTRFDLDRNGEIDLREWEIARKQAKKEVQQNTRQRTVNPQIHVLSTAKSRTQPFLLSAIPQSKLITRHRTLASVNALIFLFLGVALTWAISIRWDHTA